MTCILYTMMLLHVKNNKKKKTVVLTWKISNIIIYYSTVIIPQYLVSTYSCYVCIMWSLWINNNMVWKRCINNNSSWGGCTPSMYQYRVGNILQKGMYMFTGLVNEYIFSTHSFTKGKKLQNSDINSISILLLCIYHVSSLDKKILCIYLRYFVYFISTTRLEIH